MGKRVRVNEPYQYVILPDGTESHTAGDLVDLTDAEFASLPPALARTVTDTGVVIPDPPRAPVGGGVTGPVAWGDITGKPAYYPPDPASLGAKVYTLLVGAALPGGVPIGSLIVRY